MEPLFKTYKFGKLAAGLCIMALLASSWSASAMETDATGRTITPEIITKNFNQNLSLLKKSIKEKNVQDLIDLVNKQSDSLIRSYQILGGPNRDRLMQEKREIRLRGHFIKADQDRLEQIEKELNNMDKNGMLPKEAANVWDSITNLQNAIDSLSPQTQDDKDVNRLILQHLEFYSAMLNMIGLENPEATRKKDNQ